MDAWQKVYSFESGITNHAGLVYDNRAIIISGKVEGTELSYLGSTQVGNLRGWGVSPVTGLSARFNHAACVFDKRMFVSGGESAGVAFLNDILVSEDGKSWEQIGTMASALSNHRLVAFGDDKVKLVHLGGVTDVEYLDNIYTSSDGRNWDEVHTQGDLWDERAGFGALVYKNKLWLFGGLSNLGTTEMSYNDVWWTDDLIHWHRALESAPWSKRSDFGYCIWDERMWIIGGKTTTYDNQRQGVTTTENADVWFSRDGSTWEQAFDFPTTLSYTAAGVIDNALLVVGGVGNEHDVYKMILG
jgi:hypothetical protein